MAGAQSGECAAVERDRLLARDFAAALPAFGALPPETEIAPAPAPGARRIFREPELRGLARRFALSLTGAGELCFEWKLEPLDRGAVAAAMRAALPEPAVEIEIVETSRYAVPHGAVEFRREGLGRPADPSAKAPVVWRGSVIYGGQHRFSVWARVVVSGRVSRVVAAQPLKRGEPIRAEQVRVETSNGFPAAGDLAQAVEEVVGKVPWHDVAADSALRLSLLAEPPEVGRGDMVEVEVRNGAMRLEMTAKAESAGRSGEVIRMRNLSSNRLFQARVSGKDRAVVEQAGSHAN